MNRYGTWRWRPASSSWCPSPGCAQVRRGRGHLYMCMWVCMPVTNTQTDIRSTHIINRERKQTTNKPGFFSLLRPEAIATSEDKKFAATAQGVKKCVAFNLVLMYDVYGHGRAW